MEEWDLVATSFYYHEKNNRSDGLDKFQATNAC